MQETITMQGLPPLIDRSIQILIVGTFPSEESLGLGQYYANPRNQFWKILGLVHGDDYLLLKYEHRCARMLARRVGLWDVFASCTRAGSTDSKIRNAALNDFSNLKKVAPSLRKVLFNGEKASLHAAVFTALGMATEVLPSSSSAPAAASNTADRTIEADRPEIDQTGD
jgi:double-stranded uracil-DNA glycosylase